MRKLLLLSCLFLFTKLSAQKLDYFILFNDKATSTFAIDKPTAFLSARSVERRNVQKIAITSHDLPVSLAYINEVNKITPIRYQSRWMNGVVLKATPAELTKIKSLPFVKSVLWNGDLKNTASVQKNSTVNLTRQKFEDARSTDFGLANRQNEMIGIDKMHEAGFKGEGILIGILDSGFSNATNLSIFSNLRTKNLITATWDFVHDEENVFNDHSHGTNVLSVLAADQPGNFVGTTPNASYALFTTEDIASETRIEEVYWLLAAERADSLGVDVINSSLGYYAFDNPAQNYAKTDLDGNTTLITKAADWAAAKGIIVVTSAGNEGNNAWRTISAPADADSTLAIGAVTAEKLYVAFSSVGPSADGRVKPELSAMGVNTVVGQINNTIGSSNGTSFASPLIAGLAAGMKQAFPQLSAMKIRDLLIKSGSQYDNPDEFLGYGIPNFERAKELADFERVVATSGQALFIYPNPVSSDFSLKGIITDQEFKIPGSLKIYTMSGQLMYQTTINDNAFSIKKPVEALASGTYFIVVSDATSLISRKFVKQ